LYGGQVPESHCFSLSFKFAPMGIFHLEGTLQSGSSSNKIKTAVTRNAGGPTFLTFTPGSNKVRLPDQDPRDLKHCGPGPSACKRSPCRRAGVEHRRLRILTG
jgi:hypothetical protein